MGYLFLVIALFCGSAKGFCGKKISGKVNTFKGVFYINTLRMLICIATGFFIVLFNDVGGLKIDTYTLLITATSGVTTALFVATWIVCVKKGAYVMVDVFLMLGTTVTVVLCNLFFDEKITVYHCISFLLLLASSYIMCSYSSSEKQKMTVTSFVILVVCGLCNGLADFSQKWFVKALPEGDIAVFNFYTYAFSAAALLIFFAISSKVEKEKNDGKSLDVFLVICLMAFFLFAYSYFKTIAAKTIDSTILYPLSNSAGLVLSATMGAVFFGEKITKKAIVGIILTFMAIAVMSL